MSSLGLLAVGRCGSDDDLHEAGERGDVRRLQDGEVIAGQGVDVGRGDEFAPTAGGIGREQCAQRGELVGGADDHGAAGEVAGAMAGVGAAVRGADVERVTQVGGGGVVREQAVGFAPCGEGGEALAG